MSSQLQVVFAGGMPIAMYYTQNAGANATARTSSEANESQIVVMIAPKGA